MGDLLPPPPPFPTLHGYFAEIGRSGLKDVGINTWGALELRSLWYTQLRDMSYHVKFGSFAIKMYA